MTYLAAQQFVGSLGRVRCMVHIEGVGHRSCAGCHKPTAAGGTLGSQVGAVHKMPCDLADSSLFHKVHPQTNVT